MRHRARYYYPHVTPTTLTPGTRFGAFEILSSLREGVTGVVYRARDTRLNREVAIKVLLPAVANTSDRLVRFGWNMMVDQMASMGAAAT